MAKKKVKQVEEQPAPATQPAPAGESPTETLRVPSDLVEMLREICFHSRDGRGRRLKVVHVAEELLRPAVTKRHAEVMRKAKDAPPAAGD